MICIYPASATCRDDSFRKGCEAVCEEFSSCANCFGGSRTASAQDGFAVDNKQLRSTTTSWTSTSLTETTSSSTRSSTRSNFARLEVSWAVKWCGVTDSTLQLEEGLLGVAGDSASEPVSIKQQLARETKVQLAAKQLGMSQIARLAKLDKLIFMVAVPADYFPK